MLQCSSQGGCLPGPGGFLLGPGVGVGEGTPWSQGGFSLVLGGVLLGPGGGSPWSRGGSLETPPVDRITDTCKNITLATTSLRPVKIHFGK